MKYGVMIIVTILLMIVIMELKQQSEQLSVVGHHIEELKQIDNELKY